jgi:hypothetical protein
VCCEGTGENGTDAPVGGSADGNAGGVIARLRRRNSPRITIFGAKAKIAAKMCIGPRLSARIHS